MQNLSNPVHLHRAYPPSIAAVGEDKLIVHDGLYLFPKQAARWMDSHDLIADCGLVATIRKKPCSVRSEAFEETLQDGVCPFRRNCRNLTVF